MVHNLLSLSPIKKRKKFIALTIFPATQRYKNVNFVNLPSKFCFFKHGHIYVVLRTIYVLVMIENFEVTNLHVNRIQLVMN